MYQTKHIPIRTCVGCGAKEPQKNFIKIIRTKEKSIVIKLNNISDKDKSEGRSVYLCRSFNCWTEAIKKGKIERNIKANLSDKDKIIISDYMAKYRL
tara:strand:- start:787 stop:1077 length:291 start_codon:yes stop_codon:yes gene_type:complete